MIDNYDSFVYNLVRYFRELDQNIEIYKNDKITIKQIEVLNPEGIIISPGPMTPEQAGMSLEIIDTFKGVIPILGICLGHQAIAYSFGGQIVKGDKPMHGKISLIQNTKKHLFEGLPEKFKVTRYHSLIVDKNTLPDCLEITSVSEEGIIMGLRHKKYLLEGLQFHPEAELTEHGHQLLQNYINLCKRRKFSIV